MRPSSPKKNSSPLKNGANAGLIDSLQSENQALQLQLGERDVEIERMKITLIALNEKLAVTTDIKLELEQHKGYLAESEARRVGLQDSIDQSIQNIKASQNENDVQHDQLRKEIERLQNLLEEQRAHQEQIAKDHRAYIENLNVKHTNEINIKINEIESIK